MNRLAFALLTTTPLAACVDEVDPYADEAIKSEDGKTDASALAVFVDAQWDGTLITDSSFDDRSTIQSQLFYTVGQLNGMNAVGRIDKATFTNIENTTTATGRTQITFHAKLLVAWGNRNNVPQTITLKSPLDVSSSGQQAFVQKYNTTCVDFSAHDVNTGSMFYYYRPNRSGCTIDASDVNTVTASLSPSPVQTTGKFPEYDKIWEDDRLEIVAIFGKETAGATSPGDAGIAGYNAFVGAIKAELAPHSPTTIPANVPTNPGVSAPDIEFTAMLPDGKAVRVVTLLTDNIRTDLMREEFRTRYEALSTRADYIVYNGHAGLGRNVRALAGAGKWVQGQYVIIQLDGCDTFAYIDDSLNSAHQILNPDDTTGYKYLDLVINAMPAFFHQMPNTSMAMVRGLIGHAAPQTFEQMFRDVDDAQVVLVSGEQDNTFTPGGGGNAIEWNGLTSSGRLAHDAEQRWATPSIAAGDYELTITGTNDADLYVRIGSAPTLSQFDCRPYKTGSNESCRVSLAQAAPIHVMVRGYSTTTSTFQLVGKKL